jgi:hypothetical protein
MTRVHVFCEGQTEETFVREVLREHFEPQNIWLNPILVRTSRYGKGGISTYGKIKRQIERKCKEDETAWVTTLFDFYGLPGDFPGPSKGEILPSFNRAKKVINAFQEDIGLHNFIANLVVHEFEGLLFSYPDAFSGWFDKTEIVDEIEAIRSNYETPEHINDGNTSAPSKRILGICDSYDKVLHGSLLALDIGLDTIKDECLFFDEWLKKIEALKC